jgi:S1-C subfamily serine protease
MKILMALLMVTFLHTSPAQATMLTGIVQYRDVEGRIGVRVNHSGRVFKVHSKSPADIVGIRPGDVITSVDGIRSGFVGKIHGTPGTIVNLTVRRDHEEMAFQVPRVDFQEFQLLGSAPLLVQK